MFSSHNQAVQSKVTWHALKKYLIATSAKFQRPLYTAPYPPLPRSSNLCISVCGISWKYCVAMRHRSLYSARKQFSLRNDELFVSSQKRAHFYCIDQCTPAWIASFCLLFSVAIQCPGNTSQSGHFTEVHYIST